MRFDVFIKNGNVVFPGVGVKRAEIGVKNGKIAAIFEPGAQEDAAKTIDAQGMHVFPGVVDAHEHLGIYNSLEEDFRDTKQNAIGGVTTLVNFYRQPQSYHELMPSLIETGEKNSYVDFAYSLGILTEQHIDELETYVDRYKMTSFKFFRNYERKLNQVFNVTNGIDLSSADLMRLLAQFKEISPKMLLCIHSENMDINRYLTTQLKGQPVEDTLRTWSKTSPGYAEAESMLSTLYLNSIAEGNVFIVHLSSGASVDVLEKVPWLTQKGVNVETCIHYLTLTEDSSSLHAKVGPPIHTEWDRERLWEGIASGVINAIGTDHVPNSLAKKYAKGDGVWDALFGFPGVGALLPIMITEGHIKRGLPLERIADITSYRVAESFNLPEKGRIEVGADADFAIVDINKEETIHHSRFHSSGDYSVYDGMKASGWPVYTISRGDVIVENGQPVAEVGRGKYIKRFV